ncbi:chloride channel protein [Inquilinus limosus]|uniref:chloride channel protein n=1 Tax=Inquilinus limosus TaxID=171674 RepID=UPI00068A1EC5|nr:chloride channel protein [Inquilinus limosus]
MSRPADPAAHPRAVPPTRSARLPSARLGDFTFDRGALRLIAMAPVVGTAGTAAAWALLQLIALVTNLAYFGRISTAAVDLGRSPWGLAAALVPPVGCLIIGLMARYGSEKIRGHGIPEAIEAILIGRSRIQPKVAVLKPLSSAVSIGTGGPFGAEGPIIMTGGALGSLFAQLFHLTSAERKTLLVAGAAAGMTAIFGTPVAAVLLAVELLLFEWKPRSLIPVATAAIVAAAWRPLLFETGPLFAFSGMVDLSGPALLAVIGVGIVAGFGSGLLTALVYGFEDLFERLPIHWMWWPVLGGVAIGLGGLIEPAALGVGYDSIRALLAGHLASGEVLRLLVVKALIWAIALGSGTSGGVLAPLLIMGGALGALEGTVLPGGSGVWALLGMAAMMGGTMRSPLTAAVFAVELTGNLAMLPALLTACVAAYAVTVLLLKRSILTEKIARRGHHILREYIVDPFELTRVGDVMVAKVDTLPAAMPVDDAVAFFTEEGAGPRHKSYPVVDEAGRPVGMVARADVLRWTVSGWPRGTSLADAVSGAPLVTGHPDEMVGRVADRMAEADAGRVPVTRREDGVLVGILARKDLLRVRARLWTEEIERARLLRPGQR